MQKIARQVKALGGQMKAFTLAEAALKGSPAELVIDASADQVFGERH